MLRVHMRRGFSSFVDRVLLRVRGGKGGDGAVAFHRRTYGKVRNGTPCGGDGARGGHVLVRASSRVDHLGDLAGLGGLVAAPGGGKGGVNNRHGRNGEDVVLIVPPGTRVVDVTRRGVLSGRVEEEEEEEEAGFRLWEDEEEEEEAEEVEEVEEEGRLVADFALDLAGTRPDADAVVVARGGRGGFGNARFVSAENQAAKTAKKGWMGKERRLLFELQLIGDVGLVGLPNAGKSTLLRAMTNARPTTAPYAFTTLTPQLGVVDFKDHSRLRIADLPGLVDGASDNVGLGHAFLRHIERTSVLAYVVDVNGGAEALATLRREVEQYSKHMAERPAVVIANKMDVPGSVARLGALKDACAASGLPPPLSVSGLAKKNVNVLLRRLKTVVEETRAADAAAAEAKEKEKEKEKE